MALRITHCEDEMENLKLGLTVAMLTVEGIRTEAEDNQIDDEWLEGLRIFLRNLLCHAERIHRALGDKALVKGDDGSGPDFELIIEPSPAEASHGQAAAGEPTPQAVRESAASVVGKIKPLRRAAGR